MKVVVTGATGLVGRHLTHLLEREGVSVATLCRSPKKVSDIAAKNIFQWSHEKIPDLDSIRNCDAVVHLAGEGIADRRWTHDRKRKLSESRIEGTKNIVLAISQLSKEERPKTFISASAIGIYGNSSESQDEDSSEGTGFLAELCRKWESAALECNNLGLRTVLLRTGLVLARGGGILSKSAPIVLGNGCHWMSWIHIEDLIRFVFFALNNSELKGHFNLTSPNPVQNLDFTKSYASAKGFPFTVSVPEFVLKLALGELSQAVLANQKILPSKTLECGFKFKFDHLDLALADLGT